MQNALLLVLCALAAAAPLRVGTSGDYPPFSLVAAGGARSGFDVDIARLLGQRLDRPLELVAFRWPELSQKAGQGAFDVVASGITIRPERALVGRFTRPYAVSEAVVLIRRGDAARLRSLDDLDRADHRIAVNHGGYLESVARARLHRARIEPVGDNLRLAAPVVNGQAAALVTDSIEERSLVAAHPELVRLARLTRDRKALFVPAAAGAEGARALHADADAWLLADNTKIDRLRVQWLGPGASLGADAVRAESIVALIDQRLGLMPWVAAFKRAAKQPIEDREREQKVLASAAERARTAGLPEERVVALFTALIDAAKDIQGAAGPLEPSVDLATLRTVLTDLDERLIAELAAARNLDDGARRRLTAGIEAMTWPGLSEARRRQIAAAL